jgi:hypothetical protein
MPHRVSFVAALLLVTALAGVAWGAEPAPAAKEADATLKLAIPDVKGWERTPSRALPAAHGGYTVAFNFEPPRIAVTLYVLNRNLKQIENDLAGRPIQTEFALAKDAIYQATQKGLYKSAKEEESREATLGLLKDGPKCLYARFAITMEERQTVSEIYVLAHKNHFVKLRVTRAADGDAKAAQAALDGLYAALAKALAD